MMYHGINPEKCNVSLVKGDLHLRGDIRTFIMLGTYEAEKYRSLINSNTLTPKDALESLAILGVFSNTTYNFEKYMLDLKAQMKNATTDAEKAAIQKVIDDYNSMNSNVNSILGKLEIEVNNIANQFATTEAGITNILAEEKEKLESFLKYTPFPSKKRIFTYTTEGAGSDGQVKLIKSLGATQNQNTNNQTWNDVDGASLFISKVNFN